MKLRHLSFLGNPSFKNVGDMQHRIFTSLLESKKDASLPIPPPTIMTFQLKPTYTTGRRQLSTTSPQEIAYLKTETLYGTAEAYPALRGGQTTYHGPGQLTAYPILDLKRHGLTARCYVNLLEEVLIKSCARFGMQAFRTENTGVWVSQDKKIGAIGVHLRRHVSSDGISLNVTNEVQPWFDRIVACGLADKNATSFEGEGWKGLTVEDVTKVFVDELSNALDGVDGVESQQPTILVPMDNGNI